MRGRSVDADGEFALAFDDEVWRWADAGSRDKQVEQGSRWEAQTGVHGYKSVGLKDKVSEAGERQFS
jgi:hypothetical protein